MSSIFKKDVSRRSVLAGAGAFGAASLAFPNMAISQDGTVLTVRSYSDIQILDPAFWLSLPEADIIKYAEVSGDTNPVHLDADFAATTMFKERIAHGMLTAGFISAVFGTKLPGTGSIS